VRTLPSRTTMKHSSDRLDRLPRQSRQEDRGNMKSASVRLLASAGVIALIAAGCGTSANGDGDSSSGNEANALAEEMRSWDACEVADNLQPIWDYMQIEAVQGSDAFNSAAWGTGMDG